MSYMQSGLMDDGAKTTLLGLWMALFVIFAGRKFTQPIKVHLLNNQMPNVFVVFAVVALQESLHADTFCCLHSRMTSVTNLSSRSMLSQKTKKRP